VRKQRVRIVAHIKEDFGDGTRFQDEFKRQWYVFGFKRTIWNSARGEGGSTEGVDVDDVDCVDEEGAECKKGNSVVLTELCTL
jgi:hypothetical protein